MTSLIIFVLVNVVAWGWVAWCGYRRDGGNETRKHEAASWQPEDRRELQGVE